MDNFGLRLGPAEAFEKVVVDTINSVSGWHTEHFGQAFLSKETRDNIRSIKPPTLLRWMPDVIASHDKCAAFIEAKVTRLDTDNLDVEKKSLDAALAIQNAWGIPVLFAYKGFGTLTANEVSEAHRWEGPYNGKGSGTPFWLFRKPDPASTIAEQLEEVRTMDKAVATVIAGFPSAKEATP